MGKKGKPRKFGSLVPQGLSQPGLASEEEEQARAGILPHPPTRIPDGVHEITPFGKSACLVILECALGLAHPGRSFRM